MLGSGCKGLVVVRSKAKPLAYQTSQGLGFPSLFIHGWRAESFRSRPRAILQDARISGPLALTRVFIAANRCRGRDRSIRNGLNEEAATVLPDCRSSSCEAQPPKSDVRIGEPRLHRLSWRRSRATLARSVFRLGIFSSQGLLACNRPVIEEAVPAWWTVRKVPRRDATLRRVALLPAEVQGWQGWDSSGVISNGCHCGPPPKNGMNRRMSTALARPRPFSFGSQSMFLGCLIDPQCRAANKPAQLHESCRMGR
ncbi:hypothetical protein F4780DRAFT_663824 [Xylariomycetidae sp. FL0641]|nr:hypothetical protein F4780DRAFT_663824 [Xylariomycetidae sp. FL0641]